MENRILGNVEESPGGSSSTTTSTTQRRSSRTPKTRLPPETLNESDQYSSDDEGDYVANEIQQSSNNKNQPSKQYNYTIYDCRYCTTNFSSQEDRSIHEEKWHKSGPKPYKCKIGTCSHRFYFKEDCEIHEKYHMDQKPENNHKQGPVINLQNSEQFQQNEFPTAKLNGSVNAVNESDSSRHNIFSCELCPSRYTNKKKLKLHIKWRHTDRYQNRKLTSFKAVVNQDPASGPASSVSRKVKPSNSGCGTAAGNKEANRNFLPCSICKQGFTTHHARQVHEKVHSGDLPYSCRVCAKKFPSVSRRNYHLKATACSIASCSKGQMESNISKNASSGHPNDTIRNETETSTRPVPVPAPAPVATALIQSPSPNSSSRVNNYVSSVGSNKIKRKRQDPLSNKSKDYSCQFCGRQFTSKHSVIRHSRLHTGFKPLNCQYCPATFTRSDSLKSHVKIHSQTGRENYTHRCNICQASYRTHRALLVHWRVVHRQTELNDDHQK